MASDGGGTYVYGVLKAAMKPAMPNPNTIPALFRVGILILAIGRSKQMKPINIIGRLNKPTKGTQPFIYSLSTRNSGDTMLNSLIPSFSLNHPAQLCFDRGLIPARTGLLCFENSKDKEFRNSNTKSAVEYETVSPKFARRNLQNRTSPRASHGA